MPDSFRVTQQIPGGEPVDVTDVVTAANWTSVVPGGFGSASLTIPRLLTQKERGLLGLVTIEHDGRILFEGRVEDCFTTGARGAISTELRAFGLQRLLAGSSVRRIWSIRNALTPTASATAKGTSSAGPLVLDLADFTYSFGRYNSADPTKYGFRLALVGVATTNEAAQVGIALPTGLTGARVMFDVVVSLSTLPCLVHSSKDGGDVHEKS